MILFSCKEVDDVPPVITLLGEDSITSHPLNEPYDDMGATALDETDGDITSRIYVDNPVNVDLIGEYVITYNVVDEAGNEATPASRWVRVINQGYIYADTNYLATETQVFPFSQTCESFIDIRYDSTINYRMIFERLVCHTGYEIYADVSDSTIVIPYQVVSDSIVNYSIQGSGFINKSRILLDYKTTEDTLASLWEAEYIRQ